MSPANIIAGFRTCGVYPFNPSAISATPHTEHEDDTGTSVATSTSSSFYSHFRGDTDFYIYSHFRGDTDLYSHFRGDTDFYSHFRGDTENSIRASVDALMCI